MKIVIDIKEEMYKRLCEAKQSCADEGTMLVAIANGTPLPKGHGDLIDRDVAYDVLDNADLSLNCSGLLKYIPAVILADEGE